MKTENYIWISNSKEWKSAQTKGFTMMISKPDDIRGKYIACGDNYKEIFEDLNDEDFDEDEHIAFPIGLGEDSFPTIYKIGIYKNGQQIAKEVFASENLNEVEAEFKRMYDNTEFNPEGTDCQPETSEHAWVYKHFSEDTSNVAVFKVEDGEALHTNYTYQGCVSNRM